MLMSLNLEEGFWRCYPALRGESASHWCWCFWGWNCPCWRNCKLASAAVCWQEAVFSAWHSLELEDKSLFSPAFPSPWSTLYWRSLIRNSRQSSNGQQSLGASILRLSMEEWVWSWGNSLILPQLASPLHIKAILGADLVSMLLVSPWNLNHSFNTCGGRKPWHSVVLGQASLSICVYISFELSTQRRKDLYGFLCMYIEGKYIKITEKAVYFLSYTR